MSIPRSPGGRDHTDRRVRDLVDIAYTPTAAGAKMTADPFRSLTAANQSLTQTTALQMGTVVFALPHLNWYRVQLGATGGTLGCCMLAETGLSPLGSRTTSPIPPDSRVLVFVPPDLDYGMIVGVVPSLRVDGRRMVADFLVQGGGAEFQRERAVRHLFQLRYQDLIHDFSAGRPMDATTLDWGRITETGVGVLVDPFQVYMRVNETCGLFLNYFDSYARLAGWNFDLQTAAHQLSSRSDEGEHRLVEGYAIYPWEALGLYERGRLGAANTATDMQYNRHVGGEDLRDAEMDVQPMHRVQHHFGYLGQGGRRSVTVPPLPEGLRRYGDGEENPDVGVFEESIGLDGAYMLRSARQVVLAKRLMIPVPQEQVVPEDQEAGDDARRNNYRFSGVFGEGPEHVPGRMDAGIDDSDHHLARVAGIDDLLTHAFNWQGLHPFDYHQNDYHTPDESELVDAENYPFDRVQDGLDFNVLRHDSHMPAPTPVSVDVDHRQSQDYYQREAYIALLPDGGVVIGDGYGAQITLSGGNIRLECPGDVQLTPGRSVVAMAGDDVVLRARRSLDATAGHGDLRLKAEHNLQMLGGNSGRGGVLVESKGAGIHQDYDNRTGEEVSASGVSIKAADGGLNLWAQQIYARTGGGGLEPGNIILDAGQGQDQVVLKGRQVTAYASSAFSVYNGPMDADGASINASHHFGGNGVSLGAALNVDGGMVTTGGASFGGHVGADGMLGHTADTGGLVGRFEGEALTRFLSVIRTAGESAASNRQIGAEFHGDLFVDYLYEPHHSGHGETINRTEFSYRDDPDHAQYRTAGFQMTESRWQSMARQGGGQGGVAWEEPPVRYQGRSLLPWPGKAKWDDEQTLVRTTSTLFDHEHGIAKNRGERYESPQLDVERTTPRESYLVID